MSRLYAYIIAGIGALLIGLGIGWHFGSLHWKNKYQTLQAENWEQSAQNEKTARETLQKRLEGYEATLAHNAEVMNELNEMRVTAESQRDMARRLLNAAKASTARGCPLPEARGGQPAPATSQTPSDSTPGSVFEGTRLGELLEQAVAAAGLECHDNADQLDALIQQLRPQI